MYHQQNNRQRKYLVPSINFIKTTKGGGSQVGYITPQAFPISYGILFPKYVGYYLTKFPDGIESGTSNKTRLSSYVVARIMA